MKNRLIALAVVSSAATVWAASTLLAKAPAPAAMPVVVKAPELTKAQTDFFEVKVRPLLSANCYKCHSIETGKAKGGLTLDTREGTLKGGDNGVVVIPGDPAKSKLLVAVHYNDPDLQMPPKGEKLSDSDIATLTKWVEMGAPDPRSSGPTAGKLTGLNDKARAHWAYQPVKDQPVPQVSNAAWVKSPIDAFVLSKLEQNGMKPSAAATKEVLIRRATYDLIGLPPTPDEVQAFVNDGSANAFEKVIDRLLASPHYGERWGRFWLDSARYSDTTGAEGNLRGGEYRYAHAWTYRDYVINAFNSDKPYDRFLMEQIAADKLPTAQSDPSTLAALGFITVGKRFNNPNDVIDERIDAMSKATLGITVACARCHDHKFDPIPTADYYSLHGIFASTVEPGQAGSAKYGRQMAAGDTEFANATAEKILTQLQKTAVSNPDFADYIQKRQAIEQRNRETYYRTVERTAADFRKLASGYLQVAAASRGGDRDAQLLRLKLIADYGLDRNLFQAVRLSPREAPILGPLLRFAELPADQIPGKAAEILAEIKTGKLVFHAPKGNGRGIAVTVNPLVVAAFENVKPESLQTLKDASNVYGKLFTDLEPQFKAWLTANRNATEAADLKGFTPEQVALLQIPVEMHPAYELDTERLRSAISEIPQQNGKAFNGFGFAELNALDLTHPGAPAMPMIVVDSPNPHNSPVFIRGEAQNRGAVVPRQFLEILTGKDRKPFTIGSGRLELAQAIANKENPLTSRVIINRIWLHHFGEGFVRTPDDMGVQSEPPSHPQLLDYLATRFTQNGWSVKQMHRMIMLSSTYQQSSENRPEYSRKDPDNHLLWRANLRRLDFEAIRDTLLQMTGKLDGAVGGKPVNLTDEPYSNRRSVYGYIDRGNLPELMAQFDFSDPDMANSRRTSTIVPQQALFFMNSPMSVDVVRKVTTRPEFTNATDDAGRVKAIYDVVYQRAPKADEIQFAIDYVSAEKAAAPSPVAKGGKDVSMANRKFAKAAGQKKFAGGDRTAIRNDGDFVERKPLTPWELYAQALLFTNEVAYVN